MAAAAEHCEPEALTHAKISLSSPNFMYILVRHTHTYIPYMQTYLCTFICINTYLLGYLHDTTASTMSVVPTMRRRKATLGQLRQQISCYLQHSTYYICTYICMYIHTYDNDKDAVIYLVAVKTPTNLYKNKLHATLCPLKASKKL